VLEMTNLNKIKVAILGSQKTGKSGTLKKLLFYERNK
jgi:signal recognition particle receptor subunit beta